MYSFSCQTLNPALSSSDYIYHKNEKSKPCQTDLPLLKNDITRFFMDLKRAFYSSKHRF
jgi:hypothetical protein